MLRRTLASAALLGALAGAPALAYANPAPPAATAAAPSLTVAPERPAYATGEAVRLAGRVTDAAGAPVGGGLVVVTLDHDTEAPVTATTDATGAWRVEVPARPSWLGGAIAVDAAYVAAPDTPGAQQSTQFTVTVPGTPVTLAVAPLPAPVTQGQEVEVTGTLRLGDGRPVDRQSVYLALSPDGEALTFATTDAQGAWRAHFRVPDNAGAGDAAFPRYVVHALFAGDSGVSYEPGRGGLSSAAAEVPMTLSGPPVTRPTPTPTPTPTPAPVATPAPVQRAAVLSDRAASATNRPPQARIPRMTSPGMLLVGSGMIATVVGAAMLSHARRLRD